MGNNYQRRIWCFTLVELIVVLSIICILMALLIPALNRIEETTEDLECKRRLRNMGLGNQLYMSDNNNKAPGSNKWTGELGPYIPNIMVVEPDQGTKQWNRKYYCPSAPTPWKRSGRAYVVLWVWTIGNQHLPWSPAYYIKRPSKTKYFWDSHVKPPNYVTGANNCGNDYRHFNDTTYNAIFWDYHIEGNER